MAPTEQGEHIVSDRNDFSPSSASFERILGLGGNDFVKETAVKNKER